MVEESAGVIPVHKDSREILLVHHLAGHWGFPKGHLKTGENARRAALRELKEETGLAKVILEGKPIVEKYSFGKNGVQIEKTVSYFVGMVDTKNVTMERKELQGVAWLPYTQALERLTFSKDVLRSIKIQ